MSGVLENKLLAVYGIISDITWSNMDQMSHLGIFTIFIGIVFHRKCTACG